MELTRRYAGPPVPPPELDHTLLWSALALLLFGVPLGLLLALMRLSGKKWLVMPAAFYVNTLRSIPLVMVILWFFLLIPGYFYAAIPGGLGTKSRSEIAAIIPFTVFEAAYYSEIMRAGIQSVSKGQVNAGYAVGMTYAQCMQLIVLPQAFRNMLPVLMTQTIIRPVETYLVAAVVYFIICFSLSMLVRRLQKKIAIIR